MKGESVITKNNVWSEKEHKKKGYFKIVWGNRVV